MFNPSSSLPFLLAAMPMAMSATAQTATPPASSVAAASAASAPAPVPGAGLWEFTVTTEGGPGGGGTKTGRTCLAVESLRAAPEQTLVESAMRNTGGRASKCKFEDVHREGGESSWKAICEGPMGVIVQGAGRGRLGAEAATLSQTLEGKMFMKTLITKRAIIARRLGEGC